MFVRKKQNKGGSTSILVIDRSHDKYKILKNFGCSSDVIEIEKLVARAEDYIQEKTGLNNSLFPYQEDETILQFASTISNSQIQVIGPELIFGRLYDYIGYDVIDSDLFRHLVVSRLANPGSKLKTIDYLFRYQGIKLSIDKIYRFLDNLCYRKDRNKADKSTVQPDIKSQVEQITFEHTKSVLGGRVDVVFYDMTTLYFETEDEDDLRKTGFSKDGKHQNPQIFLGLLVGMHGNAIGYEIFEGNVFEGNTFIPLLKRMEKRFKLDHPTVIADSGLLSKKNIQGLELDGYEYILGARPKNESEWIKEQILSLKLEFNQIAVLQRSENTRLIISKTENRAKKDFHNRKRGLDRLKKRVDSGKLTKSSINNKGYNKYLKLEGEITISIDEDKFNKDQVWDGIKGYITNTKLKADEVIANYKNLWYIERAFRMSKTDLRVRPVYHRLFNRIEAHITICFTAYTIMLELERRLKTVNSKITINRAGEISLNMYQMVFQLPKSKTFRKQLLKMDTEQEELLRIIGI